MCCIAFSLPTFCHSPLVLAQFFWDLVNNRDWCCRCFAIATAYMYLTRSPDSLNWVWCMQHACCWCERRRRQSLNNNNDNTNTTQYTCAINKIGLNAFIHILFLLSSSRASLVFVRVKWAFFCVYASNIVNTYKHYTHVFRSEIFLPIQLSLGFWHIMMQTYVVCKIAMRKYFIYM